MTPGPLIIVSGPSGSGKSTLIGNVLKAGKHPLRLAVSATTRPPREGEVDGRDYHFWTVERFLKDRSAGAFLEWAQVHGMNYYGTPRSEVDGYCEKGWGVILDIDVQGAAQVRNMYPDHLSIFIALSRPEMYEQRLLHRGSETPATIARRLETSRAELARQGEYQHVVYNDDLKAATREFLDLVGHRFDHRP